MQSVQSDPRLYSPHVAKHKHRATTLLAVKLLGAAAFALSAAVPLAYGAAAEQSEIVLTASASEVGAAPGSAYALGSAALAAADQVTGAFTVAANSSAAALPDGGTEVAADTAMTEEEIGGVGKCSRC